MSEEIPKCKCGFNPSIEPQEFQIAYIEYGMLNKTLKRIADARCLTCHDKFKLEIPVR